MLRARDRAPLPFHGLPRWQTASLLCASLTLAACSLPQRADPPPAVVGHSGDAVTAPSLPLPAAETAAAQASPEVPESSAVAEPLPVTPTSGDRWQPCRHDDDEDQPIVDDASELLQETGCRAALWLDGLFGDHAHAEAAKNTHGYIETSVAYSEFNGFKSRTRLRVRFELPNLKERLSAFVGREDEDDFVRGRTEAFALRSQFPRIDDREEWLAGLGYALPDTERLQTSFRVGAASLSNPRVFVQGRLHYNLYADNNDLIYIRATPFWRTRDGVGLTLGLDYSRVLAEKLLLRLANTGTQSSSSDGVNWLTALILYQNLREQRALAYELFIRGETDAAEPLQEYGARTIYRQPLIPKKLYGEFIVGYGWPRTDPTLPREGSYEVGFGIELPFGQKLQ
jgi:hypothetical protein